MKYKKGYKIKNLKEYTYIDGAIITEITKTKVYFKLNVMKEEWRDKTFSECEKLVFDRAISNGEISVSPNKIINWKDRII